jgi:hypothetical protein
MKDLYFKGGRLRISIGGHMGLWIRWGWIAEWQLGINRRPFLRAPWGRIGR